MNIFKHLFSTKITLVLLLAFATAMGVATFIENDHGTTVARGLVYEAWWFEIIMVWMAVNFIAHIGQYKLFHKNRWPVGLFHIAFVIIIFGAGVTRYLSEEGIMHIRQGQEADVFYTTAHYFQLKETDQGSNRSIEKNLQLLPKDFQPKKINTKLGDRRFEVRFEDYIQGATEDFIPGNQTYLRISTALSGGREDYVVDKGKFIKMGSLSLSTVNDAEHPIRVFKEDGFWKIGSSVPLQVMEMNTQQMSSVQEGEVQPLKLMTLYQWEEGAFLIRDIHENSKINYIPEPDENQAKNLLDVIKYSIWTEEGSKVQEAFVKMVSFRPAWTTFDFEGRQYAMTFGSKPIKIPFKLYLNAFELERYPGSQSPSSYASEVMVMDGEEEFPYRIYMNNVLDHAGFRFYQSSYDNDERGTIFSVNQDRPGTYITYLGYTLLTLGMLLTLFAKGSRFRILNFKLNKIQKEKTIAATNSLKLEKASFIIASVLLIIISWGMVRPNVPAQSSGSQIVPDFHASQYGKLIVQDLDGRMKPLNTLANEIVRKINGKSFVEIIENGETLRLNPEQFLLAVQMDPRAYSEKPVIKIDKEKSYEVFQKLGKKPTDRLSFSDFLGKEGKYLIQEMVEHANKLKPSERNEGHNELLKTDERFNIFYGLLTGDFLRLFPNKLDYNNTWFTSQEYRQGFEEEDGIFVKNITPLYFQTISEAFESGDWEEAEETLSYISLYQQKAGSEVYPSEMDIKAELLYNKLNLGTRLFGPFWLLGLIMLFSAIWMMFKKTALIRHIWTAGILLSWIGMAAFTFHLSLRWFIAKHPPWSDGFEMLVFVAWGVLLMGLIFGNKSKFTVPLGLLFSGTLLFVSFLDWLNPEITNLMPVLHSYWLKIHVAVIVSGYAPLALAAIIALLCLLLVIFKPKNPKSSWWSSLREMQMVNEMSITIGLFLLTIGTFLGGVWANESWGRYWAWDPKETWALISVIVYAIVLHLRLIPSFKNGMVYNLASLWAFGAIIMTSFGVNYYLSGLHSYAKGDPVPVPLWVYYLVAGLIIISAVAIWKYRKISPEDVEKLSV